MDPPLSNPHFHSDPHEHTSFPTSSFHLTPPICLST